MTYCFEAICIIRKGVSYLRDFIVFIDIQFAAISALAFKLVHFLLGHTEAVAVAATTTTTTAVAAEAAVVLATKTLTVSLKNKHFGMKLAKKIVQAMD